MTSLRVPIAVAVLITAGSAAALAAWAVSPVDIPREAEARTSVRAADGGDGEDGDQEIEGLVGCHEEVTRVGRLDLTVHTSFCLEADGRFEQQRVLHLPPSRYETVEGELVVEHAPEPGATRAGTWELDRDAGLLRLTYDDGAELALPVELGPEELLVGGESWGRR